MDKILIIPKFRRLKSINFMINRLDHEIFENKNYKLFEQSGCFTIHGYTYFFSQLLKVVKSVAGGGPVLFLSPFIFFLEKRRH